MDDILGQALRSAEIVTATNQSTNQNRQIQPRPQAVRTVQNGPPTNGPSDGHSTPVARAVRTVQYRPVIRDGAPQGTPTQQVLIRQSPHPTNQNRQTNKILVVQPGNTPVRNVQTGQTLVISSSSNGQNQFQIADGQLNGPIRTNQNSGPIRTVQPGQTILRSAPRPVQNGGTPGNVRIITGRPRPSPSVRTTLIPVSSANSSTNQGTPQGSGQVRQIMVPVQTYKTTTTPGPHGAGPHNGPNGPPPRKILIQKGSPTGTPRNAPIAPPPSGAIQQPRRPMRQPNPQITEAGRQKVSVQCHEPSGSRPGFIVLQSDYIDNLRSTYSQLQRCFSTSYKDIMDINDNEHALMPKLKDIYRKADQNYRNYLTRNPLKILDNLKTVAGRNGEYVTLESYLNSQKTQNYTVRVRPDPTGGTVAQTNSPQIRNANVITVQGTPNRIRFPSSNPPNGTIKSRDSPEPKPKPQKKPTAIQLRLDADHLDQTSLLNINDPFSSIRDFQSRLLPFHCSLPPSITNQDESHAENLIMEPLCEEIRTRKRQMEQDFRNKFNNWNCLQAVGEDLLMEKLAIELEMDEIREKRQKIEKKRQERIRNRPIKEQHIHEHLNNNQNTVQMPVDDIDEHDNAVKGLLDNF